MSDTRLASFSSAREQRAAGHFVVSRRRPQDVVQTRHVGDQPRSDVAGALATGMRAALIDRYRRHRQENHSVPIFHNLDNLVDEVLAINEAAGVMA